MASVATSYNGSLDQSFLQPLVKTTRSTHTCGDDELLRRAAVLQVIAAATVLKVRCLGSRSACSQPAPEPVFKVPTARRLQLCPSSIKY
jgi:hypothetical protein